MSDESSKAVFLSYAREDTDAAKRIADALRAFGVEVWFDQSELRGGDEWDAQIKKQIRECALFIPMISATTQSRREGYFRREWKLAVERTHDMAGGVPFLLPIVVDETTEAAAVVPDEFKRVQWTRLPHGVPSTQFVEQVKRLVEPRRGTAAAASAVKPAATARPGVSRGGFVAFAAVALIAGAVWWKFSSAHSSTPATSGEPVIVMMDSRDAPRVYDPATLKNGGTNADDLTDLLRDLPVSLVKETTSRLWHREDQIARANPALIVIHRSCFYEATAFPSELGDQIYPLAADKFESFIGYAGLASPHTKFFIYTRRSWDSQKAAEQWKAELEHRFPALTGRMTVYPVPLDRATFRDPLTGREVKEEVKKILGLAPRPQG